MERVYKWWYYLIAIIPPFMGAASYVLSKHIINDISPISLLFYRWLVAILILTPFSLKKSLEELSIILANLRILFIIAISGVSLFNLFIYYALQYTTSTNVSIIVSISPVIVLALGMIVNKENIQKIRFFSIMFSFTGVVIIVSHGHILRDLSSLFNNIGDIIALGGAICWAIYVFTVKYKPQNLFSISFAYSTFLIGTVFIFPIYLIDVFYFNHTSIFNLINFGVIICLGFGVSIIGMMSLNFTISKLGSNVSAILFYLAPLFTSVMAITLLDEEFKSYHFIGMILILLGINLPLVTHFFGKN